MAAIVWADVTAWAPHLSSVHATVQADVIAWANSAFDPDEFTDGESGPKLRLCRILLAAHLATLPTTGGATGPVTSRSGGGYSESFGTIPATDELGATAYGRQLAGILRPLFSGPRVI